jgi:hypothetical protein
MRRRYALPVIASLTIGCAAQQPRVTSPPRSQPVKVAATTCAGKPSEAIVIHATHEQDGIREEHRWLGEHYPGYQLRRQALDVDEKRSFDMMEFDTADGTAKTVCFDITEFFGK